MSVVRLPHLTHPLRCVELLFPFFMEVLVVCFLDLNSAFSLYTSNLSAALSQYSLLTSHLLLHFKTLENSHGLCPWPSLLKYIYSLKSHWTSWLQILSNYFQTDTSKHDLTFLWFLHSLIHTLIYLTNIQHLLQD